MECETCNVEMAVLCFLKGEEFVTTVYKCDKCGKRVTIIEGDDSKKILENGIERNMNFL